MIEFSRDEIKRVSIDRDRVRIWLKDGTSYIVSPELYIAEDQQVKITLKHKIE